MLAPPRARLPFDDPAVQGARRAVLAGPPRRLVSTLVRGDSLFAGAVTALPDDEPEGVVADPSRACPRAAAAGGGGAARVGAHARRPVIERYGSGNPWRRDRFEG